MKERLKNLYQSGDISPRKLLDAVMKGWVTVDDVVEIVGEDNATEVIRNAKIAEISAACNAVIVAGIDLELTEGTAHFNLSIEDQSNIANLFRVVERSSPIRRTAACAAFTPPLKSPKSTSPPRRSSPRRPPTTMRSRRMYRL